MTSLQSIRENVISWAISNGTQINEFISIRASPLGGTGVFFDLRGYIDRNGGIDYDDGRIEVLRIPRALSLSLDSIAAKLLDPQTQYDLKANGHYINQSEVFTTFLNLFNAGFTDIDDYSIQSGLNETNILVGQVQILTALKSIRERLIGSNKISEEYKKFLRESPFAQFDAYLELLQWTDVGSIKLDRYYDSYKEIFQYLERPHRTQIEKIKNSAVLQALNTIDLDGVDLGLEELLDIRFLRKVEITVISRILEIPEELKVSEETGHTEKIQTQGRYDSYNKTDKTDFRTVLRSDVPNPESPIEIPEIDFEERGRYDKKSTSEAQDFRKVLRNEPLEEDPKYAYSVASTLVPIIDFINHNVELTNSTFDSDRKNGDILLELKTETLENIHDDEIELFISYDETEDALKFAHAYGFLPKNSTNGILYDLPIDRDYLLGYQADYMKNGDGYTLGLILKWFNLPGNIQFITTYDETSEKIDDVKINLDGNLIVFGFSKGLKYDKHFARKLLGFLARENEFSEETLKEYIRVYESSSTDIIESDGFTPFKYVDGEEMVDLHSLVSRTDDEEANALISRFVDFLTGYLKDRHVVLNDFLLKVAEDHFDGYSVVLEFVKFEKELIETYLKKVNSYESDEDKLDLILGVDELDDDWTKYRLRARGFPTEKYVELCNKDITRNLKTVRFNGNEEDDVNDTLD